MLRFLLGVVALGYLLGSAAGEWTTFHPQRYGDGRLPSAMGMAFENVSFRDPSGLTLRGWWIPGTAPRTIVMIHGWTSSRAEPMSKAAYLHQAGYNILVFDLRGHGTSDGSYTTMGFSEPQDVRAAVAYARLRAPGAPVALLGYSMGAALAVEDGAHDAGVVAVVEDSGYSSLLDVIGHRFSELTGLPAVLDSGMLALERIDLGFDPGQVTPASDAAVLRKPLLAIIGTADTMVPPAEGYRIFAAAAGPKQLLVIPGAGHVAGFNKDRATYTSTVLAFLGRAFAQGPTAGVTASR